MLTGHHNENQLNWSRPTPDLNNIIDKDEKSEQANYQLKEISINETWNNEKTLGIIESITNGKYENDFNGYLRKYIVHTKSQLNLDIVQKLIDKGANVNRINEFESALFVLCDFADYKYESFCEIVTLLVKNRANINQTNYRKMSPLQIFVEHNQTNIGSYNGIYNKERNDNIIKMVRCLIDNGADTSTTLVDIKALNENERLAPLIKILQQKKSFFNFKSIFNFGGNKTNNKKKKTNYRTKRRKHTRVKS
jgi:ankyrin repeat protein